jgi:hypothetical protein
MSALFAIRRRNFTTVAEPYDPDQHQEWRVIHADDREQARLRAAQKWGQWADPLWAHGGML